MSFAYLDTKFWNDKVCDNVFSGSSKYPFDPTCRALPVTASIGPCGTVREICYEGKGENKGECGAIAHHIISLDDAVSGREKERDFHILGEVGEGKFAYLGKKRSNPNWHISI